MLPGDSITDGIYCYYIITSKSLRFGGFSGIVLFVYDLKLQICVLISNSCARSALLCSLFLFHSFLPDVLRLNFQLFSLQSGYGEGEIRRVA